MAFFEESDEILNNVIGEKILRNQKLCKLLHYYSDTLDYSFNPLQEPNIADTSELLMKSVFPMAKNPDIQTEQKGYLTVVLSGADQSSDEVNTGYRRINIVFDIIIHLNQWIIDGGYRPYRIASEIDRMLNNQLTDLPILNKPSYVNFKHRDYSHHYYGFQIIYGFIVNSNIDCGQMPQNLDIDYSTDELYHKPSFLSNVLNRG